ncbi:MAG: M23 family metallopeptidase, partial [Flammeovirgaceae bacterium]|nr:M23 family metallopeptidase [Flammeovirgaceae bacterium]
MKPKKTLSDRLGTRYQLVIRHEENFKEQSTFGFTWSKVIIFSVIIFLALLILSLFLSRTILAKWFDPRYETMVMNQQLFTLKTKVDSLAIEVDRKDQFIANFQRVLSGDTSAFNDPNEKIKGEDRALTKPATLKVDQKDSAFRKAFEQSNFSVISLTSGKYRELQETFFFSPITGFISDKFDVKKGHFGVDVVAKTNESIKCIADGTVIFASWTQDAGYVMMV